VRFAKHIDKRTHAAIPNAYPAKAGYKVIALEGRPAIGAASNLRKLPARLKEDAEFSKPIQ
jgi:hypothetical protein